MSEPTKMKIDEGSFGVMNYSGTKDGAISYKDVEIEESRFYLLTKRLIDIVGSATGLILLSPILLIVALAIKIESKGPVIFKQERVGQHGKHFFMYKFRSMVINAEELKEKLAAQNEMSGPMFKMKEDPRVSLPKEVAEFKPWMMRRLDVQPGLTCYWQVAGRNNIGFKEWMEMDVYYVNTRDLKTDIKLIFKTVGVLFGDSNAS